MSVSKVLLTGGAGFIGSRLATRLNEEAIEVLIADVLHPQVHGAGRPDLLPESANLVPFDVVHAPSWDALLRLFRPDIVVHLAAETGTGQSLLESNRHSMVNVVGTTQLLDALVRAQHVPAHIVLSSSRAVYGEGEWEADDYRFYPGTRSHAELEHGRWDPRSPSGTVGQPLPSVAGKTRTEPTSVYGATKLAQEHIMKTWAAAFGSRLSILRFQNVYGVGQSLMNPYTGILSLFARMAIHHDQLPVYEDGAILRDFVYIDDVIDALWSTLSMPPEGTRLLDVGSGNSRTLFEVACLIAERSGAPEPKVTGQFRDGDVRAAACDISSAREALGYEPRWDLGAGLDSLLEWVRQELGSGANP